jgi:DNA-binding LacI/PurR family transcriptional regulator/DNA-binding transcriptional regulator YhcF (GntR family)
MALNQLQPVVAQPGRPLYQTVKDTVREAIDSGVFRPGEQMPSTKELSEQLEVSLVTAHRALQELVSAGVLQRTQGKGTFVHDRYSKDRIISDCRLGLVFNKDASLADFYHGQILEGVRQAAQNHSVDLILLRYGEDVRKECNGYLYMSPQPEELAAFTQRSNRKLPTLVVGSASPARGIPAIEVDNADLARQAVNYLAGLGHRRIGYLGGTVELSNNRERLQGFLDTCRALNLAPAEPHVLKSSGWRPDENDQGALVRLLTGPGRPTAIFAAGYYFALSVYSAAASVGLRIPEDLSVVGVDDPPSAAHLSPPLTSLREPLAQLGLAAVATIHEHLRHEGGQLAGKVLKGELLVRKSAAGIKG